MTSQENSNCQSVITDYSSAVPDDTIDTLARCLFPKIQAYFDSPEGQAEFEKWKREHEKT